jgi:hypothetical protein
MFGSKQEVISAKGIHPFRKRPIPEHLSMALHFPLHEVLHFTYTLSATSLMTEAKNISNGLIKAGQDSSDSHSLAAAWMLVAASKTEFQRPTFFVR